MFSQLLCCTLSAFLLAAAPDARPSPGYTIPLLDVSHETFRQVIVDREEGQYLGHPTTVLLEDQRTMLCVYPKGHGRGGLILKRSTDGGLTWSARLPVPASWATSREVPTIHRTVDAAGKKRLIVWSGLYPARLAVSEDDGQTWSDLQPVGDWGGIVVMGFCEPIRTGPGHYLAMFHDDGRYLTSESKQTKPVTFTLLAVESTDGGLTWSSPRQVYQSRDVHLCEPGLIRSPDGKELAVLLRENSRRKNSHILFSRDEGKTWSEPRELPGALTGDRHTGKYLADGRLFISFRDTTLHSPTKGDWVAWVGTYDDLRQNREGQYRIRLMDNHSGADCAYPGVEVLPDQTIVTTTYGHWTPGQPPYVVSVRLKLDELDRRLRAAQFESSTKTSRWAAEIASFQQRDREQPPPANPIVFTGSSSIRLWDLAPSFPGIPAINRGFGGSEMADIVEFADRIIVPYRPSLVVVYSGDNDVSRGRSPEQIAGAFRALVDRVQAVLPGTPFLVLSIKPSQSRWKFLDRIQAANDALRRQAELDPHITFVDVQSALLDEQGVPRPELFRPDQLHLSEAGYAAWSNILRPFLSGPRS